MRLINESGQTESEIIRSTTDQVMVDLKIDRHEWKQAREWNIVKHTVCSRMREQLHGRPTPIKRSKPVASREALVMLREYSPRTYPKSCNTDSKKFMHLNKLYINNEMTPKIFNELRSVLKVKEKPKLIEVVF